MTSLKTITLLLAAGIVSSAACLAQAPAPQQTQPASTQQPRQPEFIRQGQQLAREGKLSDALALYRQHLDNPTDAFAAHVAVGSVLDLMGEGAEARKNFGKAIEIAPTPQNKAAAQRAMAMSYAFEGDCAKTMEFEQKVFDYYKSISDFYQQGEISNEGARVCIDSGDLDTAYKWYQTGHEVGLRQPDIKPDRVDLWNFRWEHAQARIAARRGNKEEAQRHVVAAKEILDKGTNPNQAMFLPYLQGYVAFHRGDYKTALDDFQKSNQNDAFIQCMIGETYEKLGDNQKAVEYYKKAAATTSHNPPAAYAIRFTRMKLK
jgi:tetratricopeptide (TPR) repeat protein